MNNPLLTCDAVEDYLLQHPKFFHDHLNLLEKLSIPHPSGEAISLVSKQLDMFRNRNRELEDQLNILLEIAHENDGSYVKMHRLTLAMLSSSTLNELISQLGEVLLEFFAVDFVAVRIIGHSPNNHCRELFIAPGSDDLKPFIQELSSEQPKCGRLTLTQAQVLFADAAFEIKSAAIIPMLLSNGQAILTLGSREAERFNPNMGDMFLIQMSEIVAARLKSLLRFVDE